MMTADLEKLTPELQKNLTDFADANNLSVRELAQLYNMIAIHKFIMECHTIPITQNKTNRRWYTRLPNGKQVVKTSRTDLEEIIVSYYANLPEVKQQFMQLGLLPSKETYAMAEPPKLLNTCTLKTIYPQWLELRECEVGMNTLADDLAYWKDYIEDSIADIPLSQLGRTKLKAWGCRIIKDHSMKKKYFSNIKRTLNSMLDYAVDEEIIEANRLKDIKFNANLFRPVTPKEENEEVFTEKEQQLVMEEAEKDSMENDSALPLGICILFLTGMRVGELCALRNCDIKGNYLHINQMVTEKQSKTADGGLKRDGYMITPHAKTSAGMRKIYLIPEAKEYFRQIRELNKKNGYPCGDKDLVFQRKQGMCNQRVFDCRLKKYCNPNHLDLPFAKSCHDIRRSYISRLFDSGLNPDEIRRIAGHENIEMTMKYCRGRKSAEELEKVLEQSLST